MAKQMRLKKRMTRKMRRGGDSSSSEKVGVTHPASESRIFSRPASLKSRSASKSKSKSKSKSASKSKSKSSSKSKKSVSAEDYMKDTCPICFEHLSLRPIVTTKCQHTYHEDCLIGWCSAQRANKTCPVCRGDIKATCEAIGPFNSMEIFRYIEDRWSPRYAANNEMAALLIANPNFDPNVSASYQDSPGQMSLFWHLARDDNLELLKKLLARPDLVIPASDAADYAGDNRIRKLIIQYNKVPKALKKLWL
jgi:hypothetical protein